MDTSMLQTLWFILVGVLLTGYAILDGFDLGVGILLPFLGRTKEEKDTLINSIGPVWDGNEVWLITGGGALFAAFPLAYATAFSGFYLAMMLVLFSLIFRAVSMEFRAHDKPRAKFWESSLTAGSFLAALLFGVALGNVVYGVPLDANMEYAGNFFTLLRPVPLLFGITGLIAVLAQGASYAAIKTEEQMQARAAKAMSRILVMYLIAALGFFAVNFIIFKSTMLIPLFFTAVVITCGSLTLSKITNKKGNHGRSFLFSSTAMLGLFMAVCSVHFPNLIKASNDPALNITIYNASTSNLTLTIMSWIAIIGMPIVIGYTIFVYRLFKGKAKASY